MYNTEQKLVDSILHRFETKGIGIKKYNKDYTKVLTEVNLGHGIPDIVIVHKKRRQKTSRENALGVFDISILDIIKKRHQISMDGLLDVTKSSKSQINNSLSLLVNENIISKKSSNTFCFSNYDVDFSDCIAIEVKLKNWKRALYQAHRYKWFANEAYVLLPESNIKPALNQIELFEQYNVGLIGFKGDKFFSHFKPTKEKPISSQMLYLLNEKIISI